MHRVWAWLLARPEPHQPARRIVTLIWILAVVTIAVVLDSVPREPILRVLHILVSVVIAVGTVTIALVLWLGRRNR